MTGPSFDEPRIDPASGQERDTVELRPPLTARDEAPLRADLPSRLSDRQSHSPRTTARHFAGRRAIATVRTSSLPDAHRRRVVVTARKVLTPQGGRRLLLRHVAYIQRGAAGERDGGVFFDRSDDQIDPREFVGRSQQDRLHYRLVVNPEDGTELGDLKGYARSLMNGVAQDLGGDIEWIAGAHFDTGRPHLHILLRGRQTGGSGLRVPGAYLSTGLRDRAREVATEILGPRTERTPIRTIEADRLTPLDCKILGAAADGQIDAEQIARAFRPDALRRLIHLERKGWASPLAAGVWRIPPDLRQRLLQAGQMHARQLAVARILEYSAWRDQRPRLYAISPDPGERLIGAYVGVHRTGRYPQGAHALMLDLTDGRLGHVLMREAKSVLCLDQVKEGAVIELVAAPRCDRLADQVIAEVASQRAGIWSAEDHAIVRPGDWPKYISFHRKRAEAMSVAGACAALDHERYAIPADYLVRARQADAAQWGNAELKLRVLDDRTLEDQVSAIGLTWLDRLMTTGERPDFSGPFGEAVDRALLERAKRLRITGLGSGEPLVLCEADIHRLTAFEIKSVFETLRHDGKAVFMVASGDSATGIYAGRKHIAGVPYAVLEDPVAHNLIPWSPGLESCRGRTLTAVVQDGAASFRTVRGLGRDLGLG